MASEIKKLADELVGIVKAEWDESQHPRDEKGRFGSGGGSDRGGETDQKLMGLGWRQRDIDAMSDKEKQEKLAAGNGGTLGGEKQENQHRERIKGIAIDAKSSSDHQAAANFHHDEANRLGKGGKATEASAHRSAGDAHQKAFMAHASAKSRMDKAAAFSLSSEARSLSYKAVGKLPTSAYGEPGKDDLHHRTSSGHLD